MAQVKSSYYPGQIELKSSLQIVSQQLRLARIKQVREQEQHIAAIRSAQYRSVIEERKKEKSDSILSKKIAEKQLQQVAIVNKFQGALLQSGTAHRDASEQVVLNNQRKREKDWVKNKQSLRVEERHKIALEAKRAADDAQRRKIEGMERLRQIKDDLRQEDREDAHAYREHNYIKSVMKENQEAWLNTHHRNSAMRTQAYVYQNSLKVEERAARNIQAKVVRHGDPVSNLALERLFTLLYFNHCLLSHQ